MTAQKMRTGVLVATVLAGVALCSLPFGRADAAGDRGRGQEMAPVGPGRDGPPRDDDRRRRRDADLVTLLAGPRGAGVLDPDGWGIFDPGGWGVFDPGGWGIFDADGWGKDDDEPGPGRGPDVGSGVMLIPPPPQAGLEAGQGEHHGLGAFDRGAWGIVPLLARNRAKISVKSDEGVVTIRITSENRRAVEAIQRLIPPGKSGVWQDIDRDGPPDRRDEKPWRRADDDPDEANPLVVDTIRDGAALRMLVPHPGAEKMKDAVHLQVKAVEKLAEAVAASIEMQRILHSGRVRTYWERHSKGAALVFDGPKELRDVAGTLESFAKYLDGKSDDIPGVRRRTAPYFRTERREPPRPGPGPRR